MGAGQTYQWLTQYPDFVDIGVPFCGAAKTSLHNQVFLEGVKGAILAAKGLRSGGVGVIAAAGEDAKRATWTDDEKVVALKALGRVYAGW